MKLGPHGSNAGWTDQVVAVGDALGATGPYLYVVAAGHGPQDALREAARSADDAIHFVRLLTPLQTENANQYVARVTPVIQDWRDKAGGLGGRLVFIPGNEPDVGTNDNDVPAAWTDPTAFTRLFANICGVLRRNFPGIVLANPAWRVEHTMWLSPMMVASVDWVTCHCYWNGLADNPDWETYALHHEDFGRAYIIAATVNTGKPLVVTEVNSVGGTFPEQIAAWAKQAADSGVVYGACLFMADGQREWAGYNVTTADATKIMALIAQDAQEPPPAPPQAPEPMPPGEYTRDHDPRGYVPLRSAWRDFISMKNPAEVDAIIQVYAEGCQAIGYDANLAIAQGCVETTDFTSTRWKNSHAAAGVGIYSDGTPDIIWGALPHGDVRTGILAQIELLDDYYGEARHIWGILPSQDPPLGFDSPRGKTRLDEMDGVWAEDPGYSAAIVAVANEVAGLPSTFPAQPAPPDYLFITPVDCPVIQGSDGTFSHGGKSPGFYAIDSGCPLFTPIRAIGDGIVVWEAFNHPREGQTGHTLAVQHAGGYESRYCHLSSWDVHLGDAVRQGQIIAKTGAPDYPYPGANGFGSGPHLHWSVSLNGVWIKVEDMLADGRMVDAALAGHGKGDRMFSTDSVDDGLVEMAWRSQGISYNPQAAIFTDWKKRQYTDGDILGVPVSEERDMGWGTVQVFSTGVIASWNPNDNQVRWHGHAKEG